MPTYTLPWEERQACMGKQYGKRGGSTRKWTARVVGRAGVPKDERIVLDHVSVSGQDYSYRHFGQFCTIAARLENCRFDGAIIDQFQLGSGRESTEVIQCSFNGVRLTRGGGFTRFVRCSFLDSDLRNWLCIATEFVECVFSGRIEKAIFHGTVLPVLPQMRAQYGRDRNEFRGNDFSSAELIDVAFRTGIDLTRQKLPVGEDYLYLPHASESLERVRSRLVELYKADAELRRIANILLDPYVDDVKNGPEQLFLRKSDLYSSPALDRGGVATVLELLQSAASGPDHEKRRE
jgi:uncharacterized protein YjbI with pentapeptide repeats